MSRRTGSNSVRLALATAGCAVAALAACVVAGAAIGQPAATPTPAASPAPAADQARIAAGRDLFSTWGCTACHTLSDAKASGAVGPSLDGDTSLTEAFIVSRVTNGQGAMPAFGGQLTDKEIADVAYYIAHVKK